MSFIWDAENQRKAASLWVAGRPASYISKELGASRAAVIAKMRRLGYVKGAADSFRSPALNRLWTKQEDARLSEMWRDGLPAWDIARRLNRSTKAIWQRSATIDLPSRAKLRRPESHSASFEAPEPCANRDGLLVRKLVAMGGFAVGTRNGPVWPMIEEARRMINAQA